MPDLRMHGRRGASLIDLLIALAILSLLFGGIYLVYFSILDSTANVELRTEATAVLNQEIEVVRNLPYDKVGTVGGVPSGVIFPTKNVQWGNQIFTVTTTVRNIDDPFDGTLGGVPSDTSPADFKLVSFDIGCVNCQRSVPLSFTTHVAPKNLESVSSTGSLFVNVFDAGGAAIAGATVRIINANVTPTIDVTDVTNSSGVLQLVGAPTSTQSYSVAVTKSGYSSDQTYPIGGPSNPNPVKPHATVAAQTVTNISFAIDRVSQLIVRTSDYVCAPLASKTFSVTGEKVIGTGPDVLKFSTTSVTDASGVKTLSNIEWDRYALAFTSAGYDVRGTIPFTPAVVNPATNLDFRFVVSPASPSALLVSVKDAGGVGIQDAQVTLTKPGFTSAATTGHALLTKTDWSGGAYDSQSGGTDPNSIPGSLTLLANASGTYVVAGSDWLISQTIDLGGTASTLYTFSWAGNVPPETGAGSVKFQFAANNDNATWSFTGPDGSSGTHYTSTSSATHSSLTGKRYVRYKVFLATANELFTPRLDDVTFEFNSVCVPPYQALFPGLVNATYDIAVTAPGYENATSSAAVASAWQEQVVLMNP